MEPTTSRNIVSIKIQKKYILYVYDKHHSRHPTPKLHDLLPSSRLRAARKYQQPGAGIGCDAVKGNASTLKRVESFADLPSEPGHGLRPSSFDQVLGVGLDCSVFPLLTLHFRYRYICGCGQKPWYGSFRAAVRVIQTLWIRALIQALWIKPTSHLIQAPDMNTSAWWHFTPPLSHQFTVNCAGGGFPDQSHPVCGKPVLKFWPL